MYEWLTGDVIRGERDKRGWTQATLADHTGVDANTVARWDRGELPLSRASQRAVACAFWRQGDLFDDGRRRYRLSIPPENPHDLCFDRVRKSDGGYLRQGEAPTVRVYLGSPGLPASDIPWLLGLRPVVSAGAAAGA